MAASIGEQQCIPCDDYLKFQDALKKLRQIDDRIIYALNRSLPTQSFTKETSNFSSQCKTLYEELKLSYSQREKSIQHCLDVVSEDVKQLAKKKESSPDDSELHRALRKEQTKLRLMKQEISIEEVVKDRTLKAFYERCRDHYNPPEAPVFL